MLPVDNTIKRHVRFHAGLEIKEKALIGQSSFFVGSHVYQGFFVAFYYSEAKSTEFRMAMRVTLPSKEKKCGAKGRIDLWSPGASRCSRVKQP
jgi:hypothetical protein